MEAPKPDSTETEEEAAKCRELGRLLLRNVNIEKELECPVCLILPRAAPILVCRAGHSVCCECFPRLSRTYRSRRCPICQARYCSPPARNFTAEAVLECLERNCRFDYRGCRFSTKSSESLGAHESDCSHRPADFKVTRKHHLSQSYHLRHSEADTLQTLLQLALSVLAILIVLLFLTSLLSVLFGSLISFSRTLHSCKLSSECQLNSPNFVELWNDDLHLRAAASLHYFYSAGLCLLSGSSKLFQLSYKLGSTIRSLLDRFSCPAKMDVSSCRPASKSSLFYEWPDTFLPSHQENSVWRPGQDSVEAGNFSLVWNVEQNQYSTGAETRYGVTLTTDRRLVRSFMQWKVELGEMPRHCQIVSVEMIHQRAGVLQYWDSPLLYAAREILIVSTITGWNHPQCEGLQFGNITWNVLFNHEACRMKVDYIPEVTPHQHYRQIY